MKGIVAAGVVSAVMLAAGCASSAPIKPARAYPGEPQTAEKIASVGFRGNAIRIKLLVYKVDGQLCKDSSSYLHTFNSKPAGDLNLQLLPGPHYLELCLLKPLEVRKLKFTAEAGKFYRLALTESGVAVFAAKDGKETEVSSTLTPVPPYVEPPESDAHARLFDSRGKGTATIYRIDGFPGTIGARYSFNQGRNGIRLAPGPHTIEFSGMSGNSRQLLVQAVTFNFEAGKKYAFTFEPANAMGIELLKSNIVELTP